jgi:hypothetical protein
MERLKKLHKNYSAIKDNAEIIQSVKTSYLLGQLDKLFNVKNVPAVIQEAFK